jgi:hypothetical protein
VTRQFTAAAGGTFIPVWPTSAWKEYHLQNTLTVTAAVLIVVSVAACGPIAAAPTHLSAPVAASLKPSPVETLKPSPSATQQKPTAAPEPSETVVAAARTSAAASVAPAPATTVPAPAQTTAAPAPQRADIARLEQDGFPAQQVLPYAAGDSIEGAAYGCNTAGVGQMVLLYGSDETAQADAVRMGNGAEDGEVVSYTGNLVIVTDTCTGLSLIDAQAGWPVP